MSFGAATISGLAVLENARPVPGGGPRELLFDAHLYTCSRDGAESDSAMFVLRYFTREGDTFTPDETGVYWIVAEVSSLFSHYINNLLRLKSH